MRPCRVMQRHPRGVKERVGDIRPHLPLPSTPQATIEALRKINFLCWCCWRNEAWHLLPYKQQELFPHSPAALLASHKASITEEPGKLQCNNSMNQANPIHTPIAYESLCIVHIVWNIVCVKVCVGVYRCVCAGKPKVAAINNKRQMQFYTQWQTVHTVHSGHEISQSSAKR